ncbi:DUF732 domain-containing protein [Mycobacterium noviomagense]|uniref:DUF732 domain-containing protein n=1 Tax=Mycobacterium noviomagense TaxID=459858 RepID=A0A7I7P9T5_9MYCO|nr:DUF732 domain-containing protein [Mycobacterium noviomagense]ORB11158.1 hypothetical protein BST37_20605 [Mycobacterium noviomagense]BBY05343.1 hypothetical protein MNVI_06610 [Mycobacterium noviomagense]
MNRAAGGLCIAAVGTITWLGAGVAYADQTDSSFLAALDQDHVTYTDPTRIINYAKQVCAALHTGLPAGELVNRIQSENPKLTAQGASYFVADAVAHYCPDLNVAAQPTTGTHP